MVVENAAKKRGDGAAEQKPPDIGLDQLRDLLALGGLTGGARLDPPAQAVTQRYHPDGRTVRKVLTTNFRAAVFTESGLAGGTLRLQTAQPGGRQTSETEVEMDGDGNPRTARTRLFSADPPRLTSIDYGSVNFGSSGHPVGGTLRATSATEAGAALSTTEMEFDGDGFPRKIAAIQYLDGGPAVKSTSLIDNSEAVFNADHQVVSGTVKTTVRRPDGSLRSTITQVLPGDGSSVWTVTRLDAAGAAPTRETISSQRSDATIASRSTTLYKRGNPSAGYVTVYESDGTTIVSIEVIDYSGAQFRPDGRAVGGTIRSRCRSRTGVLLSDRITAAAADGSRTAISRFYAGDGRTVVQVTIDRIDAAGALRDRKTVHLEGGETPSTMSMARFAADGTTLIETGEARFGGGAEDRRGPIEVAIRRPDGTLKSTSVMEFAARPQEASHGY